MEADELATSAGAAIPASARLTSRQSLILAVVTVLSLAPFLGKAFHLDDPLFLWSAEQIRKHPADFYGFDVAWYFHEMPMSVVTKNPPLASYYIAVVQSLFGEGEIPLHAAFLVPAVIVVVASAALAARWRAEPIVAGLLVLFAPAFLVSATNVMCDVLMVAFWTSSVLAWDRGLRDDKTGWLVAGAFLAGLAGLTKYSGFAAALLLVVFTLSFRPARWSSLGWLLLPAAMLAGYELLTLRLYGMGLFADAAKYATENRDGGAATLLGNLFLGLMFTGGCVLGPAAASFLAWRPTRLPIVGMGVAVVAAIVAMTPSARLGLLQAGPAGWGVGAHVAIFAALGGSLLLLAASEVRRARDGVSVVLLAWIIGVFVFAAAVNWTVNARSILPMTPAAAILAVRAVGARSSLSPRATTLAMGGIVVLAGLVSEAATYADVRAAAIARNAARTIAAEYSSSRPLWFQSTWGFQYYMQREGARPFGTTGGKPAKGDYLAHPLLGANMYSLVEPVVTKVKSYEFPSAPFVATHNPAAGAGFYSVVLGPLPFRFGAPPPVAFEVKVLNSNVDTRPTEDWRDQAGPNRRP